MKYSYTVTNYEYARFPIKIVRNTGIPWKIAINTVIPEKYSYTVYTGINGMKYSYTVANYEYAWFPVKNSP